MTAPSAARIGLGIGAIMIALGLYVAIRVLLAGEPPLTGSLALDVAFGVFFVARGALAYRRWRRSNDEDR